jgi:DNA uptake protein ComE-like DNA-binding protein
MKRALVFTSSLALLTALGCSPAQRSPDAIRQDAAKATTEAAKDAHDAAKDAKAAVQGVKDGLKTTGPLNINNATADQLETLPGITPEKARRIVAGQPYANSDDLVKRHLVTQAEYDRIAGKIDTH